MSLLSYIRPMLLPLKDAPTFIYDGLGGESGSSFADTMESVRECYRNDVWKAFYDDHYDLEDYIRDGGEVIDPDTHDCDELYMNNCLCKGEKKYLAPKDTDKLSSSQTESLYDAMYDSLNFSTQSIYDELKEGDEYALEALAATGFDVTGTPASDNDELVFIVHNDGEDFFVSLDFDNMDDQCVIADSDYYVPDIDLNQKHIAQEDGHIYAVLPLRVFLFDDGGINTYDEEQECVITTINDAGILCYMFFKGDQCLKRVVDYSSPFSSTPTPAQKMFLFYVWKYIHTMTGGFIKENVLTSAIFGAEYNHVKYAFDRIITPKLLPRDFQKTLACVKEYEFDHEELEEIFNVNELFPTLIKNHHQDDLQMISSLIEDESYALIKRMCDESPSLMPKKIMQSIEGPLLFSEPKHVNLISYAFNKNPQAFHEMSSRHIKAAITALIGESFHSDNIQLSRLVRQIIQIVSSAKLDRLGLDIQFQLLSKSWSHHQYKGIADTLVTRYLQCSNNIQLLGLAILIKAKTSKYRNTENSSEQLLDWLNKQSVNPSSIYEAVCDLFRGIMNKDSNPDEFRSNVLGIIPLLFKNNKTLIVMNQQHHHTDFHDRYILNGNIPLPEKCAALMMHLNEKVLITEILPLPQVLPELAKKIAVLKKLKPDFGGYPLQNMIMKQAMKLEEEAHAEIAEAV